jgi:hypothetical protein
MTLNQFINLTNTKLEAEIGMSTFDLPDLDWYSYFDEDLNDTELNGLADEVVSDIKYDNNLI